MNLPTVEHKQSIDNCEQGMDDVLDPDDRNAACSHVFDQRDQQCAFVLSESAGDLVEQQDSRFCRQCARQLEALAIEQRQSAGRSVRLARQAAAFEQIRAAIVDGGFALVGPERGGHDDIFEDGHPRERLRDLERARQALSATPFRRQPGDVFARENDATRVRCECAGGDAEQTRFAGTVRPDDAKRLALVQCKINTVGYHDGAEAFRDRLQREDRGHG